ncbi:hypothetical protein [Psychroflexus aestuariivivens]|uniref:hypothetical protein n=1 Tax=Psychroflexus aestuariivivens TaxID=1795040 RepID=UPI000FDCA4AA|nr:hypothetical protein [Psychroflexus aestuariivivens]
MSIYKVLFKKHCDLKLSKYIEKERLKYLNQIYKHGIDKYSTFELNKVSEYLKEQDLRDKTYFFKDFDVNKVDINYNQNLLMYGDSTINFNSVKIKFTLYSKPFLFHYPNDKCGYVLEDEITKEVHFVNPSDLKGDDIEVLNIS